MLAYIGKNVTWIITSAVGLVVGVSAAILSNSASASSGTGNWVLPKLPHVPIHPPPHHGPPPAVPEVNTGLVLLPIVLAILLFTSRRFLRRGLENR
jgi:hypothetical protein